MRAHGCLYDYHVAGWKADIAKALNLFDSAYFRWGWLLQCVRGCSFVLSRSPAGLQRGVVLEGAQPLAGTPPAAGHLPQARAPSAKLALGQHGAAPAGRQLGRPVRGDVLWRGVYQVALQSLRVFAC